LGAELDASDGKTLLVRTVSGGALGEWCGTQDSGPGRTREEAEEANM